MKNYIKRNIKTKSKIKWRKWKSKIIDKPSFRNKEGGQINPIMERCRVCKKNKVKHHHTLCDRCWLANKYNKQQQIKENRGGNDKETSIQKSIV